MQRPSSDVPLARRGFQVPFAALAFAIGLAASTAFPASQEEAPPLLAVRFTPGGIEFSGTVDSEETGELLAVAARASRPGLPILNRGLTVDPEAVPLPLEDLRSLLSELSYSAHEGAFAIWSDAVLLGGLTDSRIAVAALQARLTPLLEDRRFINRVCIVPSEDLPELPALLSTGEEDGPLLDFDLYPTASERYTPPGIGLEKLVPVLLLLGEFDRIGVSPAPPGAPVPPAPLRALPLLTEPSGDHALEAEVAASAMASLLDAAAEPRSTFVELGSLLFARNTALLQGNQKNVADAIVERLKEEALVGRRLILHPVRWREGDAAFADYLVERRGEEASSLLSARGVDPNLISVQSHHATAEIDEGEVRIVVEIPPPPAEPDEAKPDEAGTTPGTGDGSAPVPAQSSPVASDAPDAPEP